MTLQRGLQVLEAVAQDPGKVTAKQLTERLGIHQGVCYHLLRTLEEGGYVIRLPKGRYDLNGRVAFLQDSFKRRLTPDLHLLNILRDLHEEIEETVCICGWHRQEIVVQSYLEPKRALHARSLEIGYADNSHARSSTRAILAFLPEDQIRAYFVCHSRPKLTPNTITDIDGLVCELGAVAQHGYSLDQEELSRGVCCIGAPFFDERAFPVGSFGVAVPVDRFHENREQLIDAVVRAARTASERLSYRGHFPPVVRQTSNGSRRQ